MRFIKIVGAGVVSQTSITAQTNSASSYEELCTLCDRLDNYVPVVLSLQTLPPHADDTASDWRCGTETVWLTRLGLVVVQ